MIPINGFSLYIEEHHNLLDVIWLNISGPEGLIKSAAPVFKVSVLRGQRLYRQVAGAAWQSYAHVNLCFDVESRCNLRALPALCLREAPVTCKAQRTYCEVLRLFC